MTEQQKQALRLRAEDLTHEEIAERMGCTKQNVGQILRGAIKDKCYSKNWRYRNVIYPNIKKWLIDNNMSISAFARNCGCSTSMSIRRAIIEGRNTNKEVIDAILRVTGMSYEVAFDKGGEKIEQREENN